MILPLDEYIGLPLGISEEGFVPLDASIVVDKTSTFYSRHLRRFYLNAVSVYPKTVYKTQWLSVRNQQLDFHNLRIKTTFILPDVVGIEFSKTKTVNCCNIPRVLEIVSGIGVIIFQKQFSSITEPLTPYLSKVKAGDKVVIPPNWQYTTVNTGSTPLGVIEYIHRDQILHQCPTEYKGVSLYLIERNGTVEIVKNSQYKNVAKYATVKPEIYAQNFDFTPEESVYKHFSVRKEPVSWVHNPSSYSWESFIELLAPDCYHNFS